MMKERLHNLMKTLPGRIGCITMAAAIALGGYWGITAVLDPYDCRIAEGVTIGGLDVGGLTKGEARKTLAAELEKSLYAQPLLLHLPEETLSLSPDDSEVRIHIRKAVGAAYDYGRGSASVSPEISLLPYLKLDQDSVKSQLNSYADQWDTVLRQPQWVLEGTRPDLSTATFSPAEKGQKLLLTLGVPEMQLDVPNIYGEILLTYDQAIALCSAGDFSVTPEVIPQALPEDPDVDAIWQEVAVLPVSDSLDMETYQFVNGSYGYGFDTDEVRTMIAEAAQGQTLEIPLTPSIPEVLGDQVYFRDVLGYCETKHTDDANRNINLQLLCKALDGHIIQPGEEFSYNTVVGERTAERGYKPATAYSGKRMIKDIGGGVCQGSTTLYNCALLADVQINERVCHGAKVGYIKLGLDAAVNWNTKTDLRFTNNFHFPMMIRAEVSDGYVKMQLLGTDEKDYYVEMYCKSGAGEAATYASSYKRKYDKETGALISDELEARSAYYELS